MGLRRELRKIQSLQAQRSDAQEEEARRLEELRKRILKGEGTTGDPITDFVIAAHKTFSSKAEKPYRDLTAMLEGREGQQVLVVSEEIYVTGKTGCFGGTRESYVQSSLRLGILTSKPRFEIGDGEGLGDFLKSTDSELSGPRIVLPTEKYAAKIHEKFSTPEWELKEGEIQIRSFEFVNFDPSGEKAESSGFFGISSHDHPSSRRLLVRIGSEQVEGYFRLDRSTLKDDISDSEIGYVEALDLLGIGDQAPNDFRKGYNEKIHESKIEILDNLRGLLSEEERLIKDINNVYEQVGGTYEDERSDRMLITMPFNREYADNLARGGIRRLEETAREIMGKLETAVGLGMYKGEWVINIGEEDTEGVEINVSKYISSLCRNYKVPIPE